MQTESFIRQKTFYCGGNKNSKAKRIEVELYPTTDKRQKRRGKKTKLSCPAQKKLNNKNSKRYFRLLFKTNFVDGDLMATLTYSPAEQPESVDQGNKQLDNFIRRAKRLAAKKREENPALPEFKFLSVTEESSKAHIIHHHVVINQCGLSREEIESLWSKPKRKGQKPQPIGLTNVIGLKLKAAEMVERITEYLTKDPKGRRMWKASRNLAKPTMSTSDSACSKSKFNKLTRLPDDCEELRNHFETARPGYRVTAIKKDFNEMTGLYAFRVRMELKPPRPGN